MEENVDKRQWNPCKEIETMDGEWIGLHGIACLSFVEMGMADFQSRIFLMPCALLSFVEYIKSNKTSNSLGLKCLAQCYVAVFIDFETPYWFLTAPLFFFYLYSLVN